MIRAISPNATPASLTVFPAGATLNPGGVILLSARATYSDGTTADVSTSAGWTTSSAAVATVSSTGLVSAVATGDVTITASLGGLTATAIIHVVAPEALPPDPVTVATEIDPAVVTTVFDSTAFLYNSANPIQRGVAAGTIDFVRAAVVRGMVTIRGGQALSGVTITVAGHPEMGTRSHVLTVASISPSTEATCSRFSTGRMATSRWTGRSSRAGMRGPLPTQRSSYLMTRERWSILLRPE